MCYIKIKVEFFNIVTDLNIKRQMLFWKGDLIMKALSFIVRTTLKYLSFVFFGALGFITMTLIIRFFYMVMAILR